MEEFNQIIIPGLGAAWVQGNQALLGAVAVGICGSRAASESGLHNARTFGTEAAKHGFAVVTGYARGVDTSAHLGAMEAGGSTIAVLAEGLSGFRVRRELKPHASPNTLLALSTYGPTERWSVWRAMNRNRVIVMLSCGLFVIEASEKGGTFEAGLECLRQKKPLWVLEYGDEAQRPKGNKILTSKGGIPVRTISELRRILSEISNGTGGSESPVQLKLVQPCP